MNQVYSFDETSIPLWVKALFWGLYMVVFVYAVWKLLNGVSKGKRQVKVGRLIVFYFAVYAVFYCVNPDYFNYREWMSVTDYDILNKEKIYATIIVLCHRLPFDYPYELFRLILWGGALLLVYHTAKKYNHLLNPGLAVLFLFVLFCGTFCYARASLAMAVFFTGISTCRCAKSSLGKMIGIGIAVCSYFFHREMIIGVAMLPGIFFPFEKKSKLFPLIILAILTAGIFYIIHSPDLLDTFFENDDIAEKVENVSNMEQGAFRMSTFIKYLNIFYPFLLIDRVFRKRGELPKGIEGMYRMTLMVLLATVAFMVVTGLRSVYTYRVMYITIIPIAIMIAYCYNQGLLKNHQIGFMLFLALLTNSMRLINAT